MGKLLIGIVCGNKLNLGFKVVNMAYLVFMNYIMLVAICGHMGIVVGDTTWLILDLLGVVALLIHCCIKLENKKIK